MFGLIVLLFTVLPALEIWVFFVIPMDLPSKLLVVLFTGIAGASLARAQGIRVLRQIQETLAGGKLPTRELLAGGIVLVGGALLLTPGFITDTIGFLCLLPPTRAMIARGLARWMNGRIELRGPGAFSARGFEFQAGPVGAGPGARPSTRGPAGLDSASQAPPHERAGANSPPARPGRLDLGAHAGRPIDRPATLEATFSVVDEEGED